MFKKIFKRIISSQVIGIYRTLKNYKTLSADFGQFPSMRLNSSVDANNAPIPWYTYPAIEFLKQLDFSDKIIFEWGSGNSTFFWANMCRKIVSVEDNREWYRKIKYKLPENVEYHLLEDKPDYITSIHKLPDKFDIIIIDGNYRYECALEALNKLRDNGFIILDNSDRNSEKKTSELLRNSDLIEVDMPGFGPINSYTWTTSFYFNRKVQLKPAYGRQPIHGIGSVKEEETE